MSKSAAKAIWTSLVVEPTQMVLGLWSRRDLVLQFTERSIEIRHRGSKLGPLWALLNPLTMLGLYFVVFGVIYDQRFGVLHGETRYDYSLALFLGLAMFHGFTETLGMAPQIIISNPNFVKKVVFPLEVLPVANVGAASFHLTVSLGLVLLGSAFGTAGVTWHVLWLPVVMVPLILLSLGIAWLLAALGVFIRDIAQVTTFIATVLLFASAVMYPPSMIPESMAFLRWNPLLQIVDLARRTVLWHEAMPWATLLYVYAFALLVFALGAALFAVLRKSFAEVI